jgi:metal-sulfur cluster biosynthetic enzyme
LRDLSRRLQKALLPRSAPAVSGFDVAAGTALLEDGSGSSIWDWFALPDGSPALVTLSVTPGDFPPAHALALVRAFLREHAEEGGDLATLLERVNTAVSRTSVPGTQGPVDCGVLVLSPQRTTWLGAGAVHGGVLRRDGRMEQLSAGGPPLGLLDGFRYGAVDVTFHPAVRNALKTVKDPELHLDLVVLGLVYDIQIEDAKVHATISLTSPFCPVAPQIVEEAKNAIANVEGVEEAEVSISFDPPWTPDRISPLIRSSLGL